MRKFGVKWTNLTLGPGCEEPKMQACAFKQLDQSQILLYAAWSKYQQMHTCTDLIVILSHVNSTQRTK